MIIDTDVIIWYLRGNSKAQKLVEQNKSFAISEVTHIELMQGMKNKQELSLYLKQLKIWKTKIIHIDESISSRAAYFVQEQYLSHSLMLAEAFIAATTIQTGETLLTANDKHYKIIHGIEIKTFRPN